MLFNLKVVGCDIESKMLSQESSIFDFRNSLLQRDRAANWTDHGNGAILTSSRLSIALIWAKKLVSIFDLNSRNKEGCQVPDGKAVLLEFFSLQIYF